MSGDDRATDFVLSLPFGWAPLCERVFMLRMPDPYTQTCPACLPVLLCLLYVVLLFRVLARRSHASEEGSEVEGHIAIY